MVFAPLWCRSAYQAAISTAISSIPSMPPVILSTRCSAPTDGVPEKAGLDAIQSTDNSASRFRNRQIGSLITVRRMLPFVAPDAPCRDDQFAA
jgi:hypothetical protein